MKKRYFNLYPVFKSLQIVFADTQLDLQAQYLCHAVEQECKRGLEALGWLSSAWRTITTRLVSEAGYERFRNVFPENGLDSGPMDTGRVSS